MSIYTFNADVAAERRRDLRLAADAHRLARSARVAGSRRKAGMLSMRIRPIRRSDAARLSAMFDALSAESRHARFLHPKSHLTAADLQSLTEVDHHDRETLVAVTRFGRSVVGLGQYVRTSGDPSTAEVAVVVADEWQDRGLGSMLAARLAARARCADLTHLQAMMAAGNARARQILAKVGHIETAVRDGATITYRARIVPTTPAHIELLTGRAPCVCVS